jgi:hypothetical protein
MLRSPAQVAAQRTSTGPVPSVHFGNGLEQEDNERERRGDGKGQGETKASVKGGSPDISASQSDALSRALDLLMEEEDFLNNAEAMHNFNNVDFNNNGNAEAGPPNNENDHGGAVMDKVDRDGEAVGHHQGKGKAAPSIDEQPPPENQPSGPERTKQHYPIPHITPSAFRQFELQQQQQGGASTSFSDTQPDSIIDFDDSVVRPSHPQPPQQQLATTTTTQAETRATAVLPPPEYLGGDAPVNAAPAQAVVVESFMEAEMEVEDDSDSFVPVLGEENWSRVRPVIPLLTYLLCPGTNLYLRMGCVDLGLEHDRPGYAW